LIESPLSCKSKAGAFLEKQTLPGNSGMWLKLRCGLQLCDQLLEWCFLVRKGAQRNLAATRLKQLGERRIAKQRGAQHQPY